MKTLKKNEKWFNKPYFSKTNLKNNESHLYAIYANSEHVNCLISRSPHISEETIASIVANSSERFINENKFCQGKFKWQDTWCAFSVLKGDIEKVCNYILKQSEHHRKVSYMEEYETFIKFYQKTINPKQGNKVFVHEAGFSTEVAI